jgi:hypothetical protein
MRYKNMRFKHLADDVVVNIKLELFTEFKRRFNLNIGYEEFTSSEYYQKAFELWLTMVGDEQITFLAHKALAKSVSLI